MKITQFLKVYKKCFPVGEGWRELVEKLIKDIIAIDPDTEVVDIKEKFGCYDKETQVLTRRGWSDFSMVTQNDYIACLENDTLVYEKPLDIIGYNYVGKMYRIKTRGVDLKVTPNHLLYISREPVINGKYKPPKYKWFPFELTDYRKYYLKNKVFKKSAKWCGCEKRFSIIPQYEYSSNCFNSKSKGTFTRLNCKKSLRLKTDDLLKFLGWYVAEGHTIGSNISICLNYKNSKEQEDVIDIVNCLGMKYKLYEKSGILRIYDKRFGLYLKRECGHLSVMKKCPSFIKELSPRQIRLFLETLYRGDGHQSKTSLILTTISKTLADDVQELLLKVGDSSRIYNARMRTNSKIHSKHAVYEVNWLKNSNIHQTQEKGLSKSSIETLVDYDGMVYCVSVPQKIIFVRRNGKPVWCGNSLRFYIYGGTDEIRELIDKAEEESVNICEQCGTRENVTTKGGWILTLCDTCRKKYEAKK